MNPAILRLTGGVLALATSMAAAITGAGTAAATCMSIGGLNNGGGCTSTAGSIAIAIGANATADAKGALNLSIAFGAKAVASTTGTLNTALAVGDDTLSVAGHASNDVFNLAVDITPDKGPSEASAGSGAGFGPGVGNVAINLAGPNTVVGSAGQFNRAINVNGATNVVAATGSLNRASNIGGSNNYVFASAGTSKSPGLSSAFNRWGNNNVVRAGTVGSPESGGPFAIAGTVGVSNRNGAPGHKPAVTQQHAGVNVKTPVNNN
jgi:hypothetical protein